MAGSCRCALLGTAILPCVLPSHHLIDTKKRRRAGSASLPVQQHPWQRQQLTKPGLLPCQGCRAPRLLFSQAEASSSNILQTPAAWMACCRPTLTMQIGRLCSPGSQQNNQRPLSIYNTPQQDQHLHCQVQAAAADYIKVTAASRIKPDC